MSRDPARLGKNRRYLARLAVALVLLLGAAMLYRAVGGPLPRFMARESTRPASADAKVPDRYDRVDAPDGPVPVIDHTPGDPTRP